MKYIYGSVAVLALAVIGWWYYKWWILGGVLVIPPALQLKNWWTKRNARKVVW